MNRFATTVTRSVINALGLKGPGPKWHTRCPAHEDHTPSLTVQLQPDDKVLVHCHAGCTPDSIVAALGMTMSDLFSTAESHGSDAAGRLEKAVYDYCNKTGELLYQVVRYDPKDFRVRRPDGNGGWIWNMKGVSHVLYRLPEIVDALNHERRIWVAEGEKDANALWALGLPATTNSGGAGKGFDEFSTTLRDAAVVIVPDNDVAGNKHADDVARTLTLVGCKVRVLSLPGLGPKEDLSDWLGRGGTRAELERLGEQAPQWSARSQVDAGRSRYRVLSPTELLSLPPARWLIDDFLPETAVAILYGQPGCYKSFLALDVVYSIAAGQDWHGRAVLQGPVAYIAAEGNASQIAKRVRAWCKYHEQSASLPVYTVCGAVDFGSEQAITELAACLPDRLQAIVVDTLSRCTTGIDENRTSDMTRVIESANRLMSLTGATVLLVHHSRKHDSTMRGSSTLEGAADATIAMKKQGPSVKVTCSKQKDAAEFSEFWLRLEPVAESGVLVDMTTSSTPTRDELSRNDRALLACLPEVGATSEDWRQLFAKAPSSYYKSRKRLLEAQLVEESSTDMWRRVLPLQKSDDLAA